MAKTIIKKEEEGADDHDERPVCGIIMPISKSDDFYTALHWEQVKLVIEEVVQDAGFKPNLVSDADDVGIIHNRIVKNLADNPIVICDVSSKNPNVMFELGLRLAFDRATIIMKDDKTDYSFDTAIIEHLGYNSTLHYFDILAFKVKLKQKIESTYEASKDPNYSTFLKNFVNYKRVLETQSVNDTEFILKQLEKISLQVQRIEESKRVYKSYEGPNRTLSYEILRLALRPIINNYLLREGFKKIDNIIVDNVLRNFNLFMDTTHPELKKGVSQDTFNRICYELILAFFNGKDE